MEGAWYVVLRDILLILAAAAVILAAGFGGLVAWQLYRLGREVHSELQPLLASLQDTADTVRNTAGFVSERMVSPAEGAVGMAASAFGVFQLVQELYKNRRRPQGGGG